MKGLEGKRAIVTGAGGVIGRAISARLAEARVFVAVFDKNAEAASETVRHLESAGGRARAFAVDITDHAAVERAVSELEEEVGPVDMAERRAGRVVNIASDAGRVGSSGESVYSACKGGIIAFSKTLARELASAQINVNVVAPGPTESPILDSFLGEGEHGKKIYEGLKRAIPFKRLGRGEDVAGLVAFLASDEAAFITGQVVSVSGGLTMHG